MNRVVMFSSGIGSWAAAKRVVERYGADEVVLLFADTREEDEDNYRFLDEAAVNVGVPLIRVADGRTPWDVFFDVKFIGNSRVDPCSRVLKRELLRRWLEQNCEVESTVIYLGIDWTEAHRFEKAADRWKPWMVEAPLCEKPLIWKPDLLTHARKQGIEPRRLYALGFPHANCGGACIKAGHAQWALLLRTRPEIFARWEENEQQFRTLHGKDVAILRDRINGVSRPLPLKEFRQRIEAAWQPDLFDWGGCGCFSGSD